MLFEQKCSPFWGIESRTQFSWSGCLVDSGDSIEGNGFSVMLVGDVVVRITCTNGQVVAPFEDLASWKQRCEQGSAEPHLHNLACMHVSHLTYNLLIHHFTTTSCYILVRFEPMFADRISQFNFDHANPEAYDRSLISGYNLLKQSECQKLLPVPEPPPNHSRNKRVCTKGYLQMLHMNMNSAEQAKPSHTPTASA